MSTNKDGIVTRLVFPADFILTELEMAVCKEINKDYADYPAENYINDLLQNGCQSGMVNSLIYYKDTIKFYKKHKEEILKLLIEFMKETGHESFAELFMGKWDNDDPFAEAELNQNLLAWFGFEETAFNLARYAGIDI